MSKGNYSVDKANEAVHYYQKQLFLIHEVHDASPLMYSHAMVKGMTKLSYSSLYTSLCIIVHKGLSDLLAFSLLKQALRQVKEKPILTPAGYVCMHPVAGELARAAFS